MEIELPQDPEFETRAGASEDALAAAQRDLGVALPDDYVAFLRQSDGAGGWLGDSPVQLWPAGELAHHNREQPDYGEGLVLIGSDGCGNALALNLASTPATAVAFPWVGGPEPEATETYAGGFAELLSDYGRWFGE